MPAAVRTARSRVRRLFFGAIDAAHPHFRPVSLRYSNHVSQHGFHRDISMDTGFRRLFWHVNPFFVKIYVAPSQPRDFLGPDAGENTEKLIRQQCDIRFDSCVEQRFDWRITRFPPALSAMPSQRAARDWWRTSPGALKFNAARSTRRKAFRTLNVMPAVESSISADVMSETFFFAKRRGAAGFARRTAAR